MNASAQQRDRSDSDGRRFSSVDHRRYTWCRWPD